MFVVVNNSGKIYALDMQSAGYKGLVTGLTSPRYIHFLSENKAYVSDLYSHNLWIVNPKSYQITGEIELKQGHTSEYMVQIGNFVYVSSWSFDEYLLIIDTETDFLVDSIRVHPQPKAPSGPLLGSADPFSCLRARKTGRPAAGSYVS